MTPEQLAEIKARTDAATPAPWTGIWGDGLARIDWDYTTTENLNFVAHARDDIPKLIAALKAAWASECEWQTHHANWIIEEENLRAKLAVATKALEKYAARPCYLTAETAKAALREIEGDGRSRADHLP